MENQELLYVVLLTKEQKQRMITTLKDQHGFEDIFVEIDLAEELDEFLGHE